MDRCTGILPGRRGLRDTAAVSAVWIRLRVEMRSRWPSWAALTLLIGLVGGVALAAAAGARRTETAYPRFLDSSHAADVLVSGEASGQAGYYDAVAALPEVESLGVVVGLMAVPVTAAGQRDLGTAVAAPGDAHYGVDVERPKLVAGRMFRPDRRDEAVIDQTAVEHLSLRIGSTVTIYLFPNVDPQPDPSRDEPSIRLSARVVGIIATRNSVIPPTELDSEPLVLLTPAAVTTIGLKYAAFDGAYVRLRPRTSAAAFKDRVAALAKHFPEVGERQLFVDEAAQVASVRRAILPVVAALALFSLLTAATALFVIGQMVSRQLFYSSNDYSTLRALGMTRVQLFAVGLGKVGLIAACGATLAVVGATAMSPLMPIGAARLAEPHPGISVDIAVCAIGFISIVVLLILTAIWPALRLASSGSAADEAEAYARHVDVTRRPSAIANRTRWLTAWPTAAVGLRMAAEPGRGRTAVPVRSTLAGTIIALAAVIAALIFGTNLNRLVTTPHLFGQTWDMALSRDFSTIPTAQTSERLADQAGVSAWTFGNYGTLTANGQQIPAIGLDPGEGSLLFPTLLEGRASADANEIVLGTGTLQKIHRRVGDVVDVQANGRSAKLHIVGRAIFPAFSQGSFAATGLGEGAVVRGGMLATPATRATDIYNFVLIRLASGADSQTTSAELAESLCPQSRASGCLLTTQRPSQIVSYTGIQRIPLVLSAVLAVLAIATFVHLLATSTRRRRPDLAILKILGFVRGQVMAAVVWQACALAIVAMGIGIPCGVILGRWAWIAFANRLGVYTEPNVPPIVLLAIPAVLLVVNIAASVPSLTAARAKPASVLQAE